jgi:molybdopterin molybdotransferase
MTLVEPRWDVARGVLAAALTPLAPVRRILSSCDGLVLAEDLISLCALPSFETSAMDGWAVAGSGPWTIVGESLAGRAVPGPLAQGQAVVIATGAVVPEGSEAVVRSEDGQVQVRGGEEVLSAPAPVSTHVRPAGEECAEGEVLAPAGTVVTPALIGLAAASGHDELTVVPAPRVALVLFGDELATAGVPARGLVRDSLGPQVPAWVARMGADVVVVERCEDTLAAHVEAIRRATAAADVVLTTGGTAAGPVDHLHEAIALCDGEVMVDSVAVRPGHPMLAARLDRGRTWLVGLPGNPQSAIVTLMSLGAPILAALAGRPALPVLGEVTCSEAVVAPAHEDRLVLGQVRDGEFVPGSYLGSGMLRGLAAATGFAVLPPGGVVAGERVRWLPLPE